MSLFIGVFYFSKEFRDWIFDVVLGWINRLKLSENGWLMIPGPTSKYAEEEKEGNVSLVFEFLN